MKVVGVLRRFGLVVLLVELLIVLATEWHPLLAVAAVALGEVLFRVRRAVWGW